jgi:hypothetical protein
MHKEIKENKSCNSTTTTLKKVFQNFWTKELLISHRPITLTAGLYSQQSSAPSTKGFNMTVSQSTENENRKTTVAVRIWRPEQRSQTCGLPNFFFFTFLWPRIITNFFTTKPIRCTNFTNLFWRETPDDRQFLCPSSGVYSLYSQQWYMSYRFVNSFRAGPGVWHIPLLSVQWINSWWWTEELSKTCRVSAKNEFVKLVHLVGFIIKKCGLPVHFIQPSHAFYSNYGTLPSSVSCF